MTTDEIKKIDKELKNLIKLRLDLEDKLENEQFQILQPLFSKLVSDLEKLEFVDKILIKKKKGTKLISHLKMVFSKEFYGRTFTKEIRQLTDFAINIDSFKRNLHLEIHSANVRFSKKEIVKQTNLNCKVTDSVITELNSLTYNR